LDGHKDMLMLRGGINPDLLYRYGMLMMSVERYEGAMKAFEKALQANPQFFRARNKLLVCQMLRNHEDEAFEQLSFENVMSRETLELHYKTAILYCDKVRFSSSLAVVEKQMAENYAFGNARANVSLVLQNLGVIDRAQAMLEGLSNTAINTNAQG